MPIAEKRDVPGSRADASTSEKATLAIICPFLTRIVEHYLCTFYAHCKMCCRCVARVCRGRYRADHYLARHFYYLSHLSASDDRANPRAPFTLQIGRAPV